MRLLNFDLNADPDPAFYSNADPAFYSNADPAFYSNADPYPAFYCNADPDLTFNSNADPIQLPKIMLIHADPVSHSGRKSPVILITVFKQ
jgi:hypothetical protein